MTTGDPSRPRVAILDDWQDVARSCADWSAVAALADITVFSDHIDDESALVERLEPFSVLCVMRERTPLTRTLLEQLPRLRFVASTGPANAAIDAVAAGRLGIEIAHTGYVSTPTVELTWALILASQRHLLAEAASLRGGGWQIRLGRELWGRTLGLLGLGRVGSAVARIGLVFGMEVVAWSENLTTDRASEAGVRAVSKEELFARADILSIHLVLSQRTRGLVDDPAISLMKGNSWLVNTSRGPIVEEDAVIRALSAGMVAGYAVDVFNTEPLPPNHPFRSMPNVLATPHIGFVAEDLYRTFYGDSARSIGAWLRSTKRQQASPCSAK